MAKQFKIKKGHVLLLKVVGPEGQSYGGFVWPLTVGAEVVAPDWSPVAECGRGLHAWLWGCGDIDAANRRPESEGARWLVLLAEASHVVNLGGKVKVPRCKVVAVSTDRTEMANLIARHRPAGQAMPMFSQAAAGEAGQAAAGYGGQAAAGVRGQAAAGYAGQAAAGEAGQAAAGYAGQAAAGEAGQAAAGYAGQAAAGYAGQAAAGEAGQAAAGYAGQAAAGYAGQAAAGYAGQAAAGEAGQAAAGEAGQAAAGARGQAAAGYAGQAAAGPDGLATCGVKGLVRGGARAVLVALYALPTGGHSYSVGQVGVAGVEPDTWYEGSDAGLRSVPADDPRVQSWDRAWALFKARKADRQALEKRRQEAVDAAERGDVVKTITAANKAVARG